MRIILLGAPGSGKGSVAKPLSEHYGIPAISTGDIFRNNIKNGTEIGRLAKTYIDNGQLVPDSVTIEILKNRIGEADCRTGFILDGFPRTVTQAEELCKILEAAGIKLDLVLNIWLDDEVIIKRLSNRLVCAKCGETYNATSRPPRIHGICDVCGGNVTKRVDDSPEVVKKRLENYYASTQPLIDFYAKRDKLVRMDNNCSIKEGLQRALDAINGFVDNHSIESETQRI